MSYLKWLRSQKVEFFERLFSKKFGYGSLPKIDWNNPRVICIAESYNRFDTDALEFISVNLELYRYQYYENGIFILENVKGEVYSRATPQSSEIKEQVKTKDGVNGADLDNHLGNSQSDIKALFYELQEKILELDEKIERVVNTAYIGFRTTKIFVEVHVQKDNILLVLRKVDYSDVLAQVEEIPPSHGWGKKIKTRIRTRDDLNIIMLLVERSYEVIK